MSHTISPEVADILTRSTVDGMMLRLPEGKLPRPLYEATNKALTMLGGKWDRRQGGHVFPFDPAAHVSKRGRRHCKICALARNNLRRAAMKEAGIVRTS